MKAIEKPVTVKIRKGFDDDHINAVEIAKIAEEAGASAVAVHGRTREEAIAKMKSALGEVVIQGVDTNIDYQFEILSHPDFQNGNFNVGFLSTHEIGGVKVNEI